MGVVEAYEQFLKNKVRLAKQSGFDIDEADINPALKPHNKLMVKWLVQGGRRACFAAFGLHKTVTQLETIRLILNQTGGRGLIICPLNVRGEFIRDAQNRLGWEVLPKFIRRIEEADETGIYITNYETVRDGKLDPRLFEVASLDEASILRGFGGSKTFREFMRLFTGDAGPLGDRRGTACVPYRFVATATPAPNDYIELLAYADFLGVMDVSQAKTRFFKRDSTKADHLTLHPHKEEEFWLWVASWGLFVTQPSDITGDTTDDIGYELEPLTPDHPAVHWHEIPDDQSDAGIGMDGQYLLVKKLALGLEASAKEKRASMAVRIAKVMELRAEDPGKHRIIWHDLEDERKLLKKIAPSIAMVYGTQKLEDRENIIVDFMEGRIQELGGKPSMLGSGTNLQRHCGWAIYTGFGFKFNEFIQSLHRIHRYGGIAFRRFDLIHTESERPVKKAIVRKWNQHNKLVKRMTDLIKQYGLSRAAMVQTLTRKMGIERIEVKGKRFTAIQNDCVKEMFSMDGDSIGLILSSIPFSTQYEYSPNFADFGHTENNKEFFEQMDFLTPQLFRVLMPGRIAAIHVKDRIVPGGMSGFGFPTTYRFADKVCDHFEKYGFGFLGRKTIVTDVVRENKQTNRLGWTEQCKDGSRMGVGQSEYLLLFRKPPTDRSNGYADIPVFKDKPLQLLADGTTRRFKNRTREPIIPGTGYSRSRWQIDAHGYSRSDGNRHLKPEEVAGWEHAKIFQAYRDWSLNEVYDFEFHVQIGEEIEKAGRLPTGFMLLQPQSWSAEVWTDITRMITLNSRQWSKGKEMHLCPLQLDLGRRVIAQMSNKGDKILDPFAGLFSVPMLAVELERYGIGIELAPPYFLDGVHYCQSAEVKLDTPTLFDALQIENLESLQQPA